MEKHEDNNGSRKSREEAERQISVADEFIQLAEKYCMTQLEEEA